MGLPQMRMKNTPRFSQYCDVVAAAVAGNADAQDFVRRLLAEAELAKALDTPPRA